MRAAKGRQSKGRISGRTRISRGGEPKATQGKYKFDVFISYSSKDKKWVRGELLKRIEKVGLRTLIDFRDFERGQPSIKEMERAVKKSRKTLLVLTPNYLKSEWCEFESLMVATLTPANRKRRLIPLLKTPCKKPLRINLFTHIDFTDGADLDLAWRQLLTALGAPPEQKAPERPAREQWFLAHPYPMPPNFTGRLDERKMLTDWRDADAAHPLLVLRALGGFGKSALAWHWLLNDVAPAVWPRVVWWSFYEGDASFEHFLTETLDYLSAGKIQPEKLSAKNAVRTLLETLHPPGTLLVLDGFERQLRAFGGLNAAYQGDEAARTETNERDCISPLAELFLYHVALHPRLRSRVLLTTRLCPRVLEAKGGALLQGCREEELRQMQPADAVEFFHAQGIRGTHTEIETACEPYGYHPLSLRLLAGLIVRDFQQSGDIAAAKRLDIAGDLVARQHHVLEVAYESLTPARQALLGRIGCFRSPVKYEALKALAETAEKSSATLEADLRDLVARGLLHHDVKEGRFDLHPIVRRYAYDRLAAPERKKAHTTLRGYFAAVPPPDKVTRIEDLTPVIEVYHHTVRAGQLDEAWILFLDRVWRPLFYQLGGYQVQIDLLRGLFTDVEDPSTSSEQAALPRLKNESHQAWTLNELANAHSMTGQPHRAVALFKQHNAICEKLDDKSALAIGLENVAITQTSIGALRAAEANLTRSIDLCQQINDEFKEAIGHQNLARLLTDRGQWPDAEAELAKSTRCWQGGAIRSEMFRDYGWNVRRDSAYDAWLTITQCRLGIKSALRSPESAIGSAEQTLGYAMETSQNPYPCEAQFVVAHWVLGTAYRVAGRFDEAERHLHEALEHCRGINMVDHEADILIDLARLRIATPSTGSGQAALDEARRLAEEARLITERSGYVLQGADAHLELAKLALARNDKDAAKEHARRARDLATCDGPPDYTYTAAYDEAGALLAQLGAAG